MIYDASNLKAIFFEKLPFKKLTVKYAKQLKPFKTGIQSRNFEISSSQTDTGKSVKQINILGKVRDKGDGELK